MSPQDEIRKEVGPLGHDEEISVLIGSSRGLLLCSALRPVRGELATGALKRALGRTQPGWHPELGLAGCRAGRNTSLLFISHSGQTSLTHGLGPHPTTDAFSPLLPLSVSPFPQSIVVHVHHITTQ